MDVVITGPAIPASGWPWLMGHPTASRFRCSKTIGGLQTSGPGNAGAVSSGLVRHLDPDQKAKPVLSFGCSSYGYDLRLSSQEFMIFRHVPGTVMNPKRFNPAV